MSATGHDVPDDPVALRMAVLRQIDLAAHASLQLALPALNDSCAHEADRVALVDLLTHVAVEAPDAALALSERLGSLPEALADLIGLRRWALHGLQRHRHDAKRRLHHFEWGDPMLFCDPRSDGDSAHLLARRRALAHYLDGFGCPDLRMDLHEPQLAGQPPQAIAVAEGVILFARRCHAVPAARRDALYRAAVAHAAAHLCHSALARPAGNRHPSVLAMLGLIEDARVERLMMRDYPGLRALWGGFHTATADLAGFDFSGLTSRLARALHDPDYVDANVWVNKGRQMFEDAAAHNMHDQAAFDKVGRVLAIDMEKMRQRAAPNYRAQPPYRDDNSLLWNLDSALPLDEENFAAKEHFELGADKMPESDLRRVQLDPRKRTRYPEWDHRLQALREDWATVIETGTPAQRQPAIRGVHKRSAYRVRGLERTPDRSVRINRLAEGDELDLNAAVANVIDQRARLTPDGRIFRRHGHRRRASAVVLLMDLSESTHRFVPGSFSTVLSVEKRAAALVAQALDRTHDRVAVHGFASSGRHEVNYLCVKDFEEPFEVAQQSRLGELKSGLSTRMGAALRHASSCLAGQSADHKLILLLTDGEPSDIDVFDEDYLVEDARHAVTSASASGIRTFCVTLDRKADAYVRRIFGARNYLITDSAAAFAGHAGQSLVRLVAH